MDEYNLFSQCHMNSFDDDDFFSHGIPNALPGNSLQQSLSCESYSYQTCTSKSLSNSPPDHKASFERPTKQFKTNGWNSSIMEQLSPKLSSSSSSSPSSTTSCSSHLLSFEKSNSSAGNAPQTQFYGFDHTFKKNEVVSQSGNIHCSVLSRKGSSENQGTKRSGGHTQDHIMAERKRREKLSQSFIALSALVPGLKKVVFFHFKLPVPYCQNSNASYYTS